MPQRFRSLLTLLLTITQVMAATVAAPTSAATTNRPCCCSSASECCCSSQEKRAGCCCQQRAGMKTANLRAQSASCCSQEPARHSCLGCTCGCQQPSQPPAAPGQPATEGQERLQRLAAETADCEATATVLDSHQGSFFASGPSADAFFAGIDQQPLFCAWLL